MQVFRGHFAGLLMAQFDFDGILLETGLLQTGFHAAGLSLEAAMSYIAMCDLDVGIRHRFLFATRPPYDGTPLLRDGSPQRKQHDFLSQR